MEKNVFPYTKGGLPYTSPKGTRFFFACFPATPTAVATFENKNSEPIV